MHSQSLYKLLHKWLYILEVILYNPDVSCVVTEKWMIIIQTDTFNGIIFSFVGEWLMILKEYMLKNYLSLFFLSDCTILVLL